MTEGARIYQLSRFMSGMLLRLKDGRLGKGKIRSDKRGQEKVKKTLCCLTSSTIKETT